MNKKRFKNILKKVHPFSDLACEYLWKYYDYPKKVNEKWVKEIGRKWNEFNCSYFYYEYTELLVENGYPYNSYDASAEQTKALVEAFNKKGCAVYMLNGKILWSEYEKHKKEYLKDNLCYKRLCFPRKIWRKGILIHQYIPAKNIETQEIGLYDIVSDTFYKCEM